MGLFEKIGESQDFLIQQNSPTWKNTKVTVTPLGFLVWPKKARSKMAGNGWSIGWNTRSSTSMSTPKRRLASSCGVAWSKKWVFFTVQNQGEICGMRHQVDCDCFFVAELCRVRIFARVFGWFWQGSAPTTSQKLKPQSKVLILSWKQPVTRIGIWFVCCLLASFEESADGRSRVEDSVQMTGEHDLQ